MDLCAFLDSKTYIVRPCLRESVSKRECKSQRNRNRKKQSETETEKRDYEELEEIKIDFGIFKNNL